MHIVRSCHVRLCAYYEAGVYRADLYFWPNRRRTRVVLENVSAPARGTRKCVTAAAQREAARLPSFKAPVSAVARRCKAERRIRSVVDVRAYNACVWRLFSVYAPISLGLFLLSRKCALSLQGRGVGFGGLLTRLYIKEQILTSTRGQSMYFFFFTPLHQSIRKLYVRM